MCLQVAPVSRGWYPWQVKLQSIFVEVQTFVKDKMRLKFESYEKEKIFKRSSRSNPTNKISCAQLRCTSLTHTDWLKILREISEPTWRNFTRAFFFLGLGQVLIANFYVKIANENIPFIFTTSGATIKGNKGSSF